MKIKTASMIFVSIATSVSAKPSMGIRTNDPRVTSPSKENFKNHYIEVDGYSKLVTDDEAINELNLDPIKVKLMDTKDGPGWSLEKADEYGEKYKAFLYLTKKYGHKKIVPAKDVDEVWHTHILDTYKYHDDCDKIFGHYLHHFPYFGMRNEDDEKDLTSSFSETFDIYRKEFPSTVSKKIISKIALCIGESRCNVKANEVEKIALCIGESRCNVKSVPVVKPTEENSEEQIALCIGESRCNVKSVPVVKSRNESKDEIALCIGESRCNVKQSIVGQKTPSEEFADNRELFSQRIRPRIDRSTGKSYYQE